MDPKMRTRLKRRLYKNEENAKKGDYSKNEDNTINEEYQNQAVAELGQAQLKLGLGFTSMLEN